MTDRKKFILNLRHGDEVFWDDPGNGVSSGIYNVVDVCIDGDDEPDENTIVIIKNKAGSETEVFMKELL